MATQKSTHPTADHAVEKLLAEIAHMAYVTETRLVITPTDDPDLKGYEIDQLRETIKRLGWMADVALRRLDSMSCIYEGDAASWLLPSACRAALAQGVQS